MDRRPVPGLALILAAGLSFGVALLCLAVVAADLSLAFAFGLLVMVAIVIVTIAAPYYGLLAYIAATYLRPGDRFEVLEPLRMVLLLAALTFGVWLAQYLIRRKPPLVHHAVLRDEAWLAVAAFWSMVPLSVQLGFDYMINGLLKAMALSLLIANLVRSAPRLRTLCWLVVCSAAANSALAWHELVLGAQLQFEDRAAGVGVLNDPNDLALTLVTVLPLAVALFLAERGFYRRLGLAVIVGALIGGVIISQSRGGALGLRSCCSSKATTALRNRGARTLYTAAGVTIGLLGVTALLLARGQSWASSARIRMSTTARAPGWPATGCSWTTPPPASGSTSSRPAG